MNTLERLRLEKNMNERLEELLVKEKKLEVIRDYCKRLPYDAHARYILEVLGE